MRRVFPLFFFFLLCFSLSAQNFKSIYLGGDYLYYKDALFKLDTVKNKYLQSFYINFESAKEAPFGKSEDVLYPNEFHNTNLDSLKNKVYKVERIYQKETRPVFFLREIETGNFIYYAYDALSAFKFPFVVQLAIDENEITKSKIERRVDEITDVTTINSPYFHSDRSVNDVVLYKKIKGNTTEYYLRLLARGLNPEVMIKGVTILFDDGTKIKKPNIDIDVNVSDDGEWYEYTAFFRLTRSDLNILKSKNIKQYRLYVFDNHLLGDKEPERIKTYINYIIEAE